MISSDFLNTFGIKNDVIIPAKKIATPAIKNTMPTPIHWAKTAQHQTINVM